MASPASASNLVEVPDPPLPSRTSPVQEMSAAEKLKLTLMLAAFGLALCAGSWWLLHNDYTLWGIVAGAVGLFCMVAGLGPKNLKAACPYCGAGIKTISRKDRGEGEYIHCEKCQEYSTANAGILRPLDPNTTSETPRFESAVFKNGVWPNGCVACVDNT